MFIKNMTNSHGWVHPSVVEDLWKDHFDYFYETYDNFCFPVTIHPDVCGHPHALKMLERYVRNGLLISHPSCCVQNMLINPREE